MTILLLIANVILLTRVIKVLTVKLRADVSNTNEILVKSAKSVGFLIPLFGTQTLLVCFNPFHDRRDVLDGLWQIVNTFMTGFQGSAVALVYCYFNTEVQHHFKRKLKNYPGLYQYFKVSVKILFTEF